jgi:hypothetical protein
MRLALQDLCTVHPALLEHPVDLSQCGGLVIQRARHTSPVVAGIDHDGLAGTAEIEWQLQDLTLLEVLDHHRLTEDGAEAVALAYANAKAGWVVERRLQRGDSADWLMRSVAGLLALEVSGTAAGDPFVRMSEKKRQVARCTLPVQLLAIVVAFDRPLILAAST